MNKLPVVLSFLLATSLTSLAAPGYDVAPVPAETRAAFHDGQRQAHVLVDPDDYTWGMSVIQWSDGSYHGYYARWLRSVGFNGWMTHCEIAHARSSRPEGPFTPVGVAVQSRHLDGWDVINAHNPYATVAEGKVCLYYISEHIRGKYPDNPNAPYPGESWMKKHRKTILRNAQCTGVAVADNPDGPFVRHPAPVVVPHGLFKNIAVNPAVVFQGGRYVMIIKGDDVKKKEWFRIQLVGHSQSPQGPFTFQKQPVFDQVQTEDACLWYNQNQKQFNMVCHVMGRRDLAHFVSDDSITWKPAAQPVFMNKEIPLDDGTNWKPQRVERPFVLTNPIGEPVAIYLAISDQGITGNIALKLRPRD